MNLCCVTLLRCRSFILSDNLFLINCICKITCKLLTAVSGEEALEYINSLSDDEIEETEMVINPPNPNFVRNEEDIDESRANQPVMCYEREIPDTIGTIEILVNDSD